MGDHDALTFSTPSLLGVWIFFIMDVRNRCCPLGNFAKKKRVPMVELELKMRIMITLGVILLSFFIWVCVNKNLTLRQNDTDTDEIFTNSNVVCSKNNIFVA